MNKKMVELEEIVIELEKRLSNLEQIFRDVCKNLNEIVDGWEKVILDFADTFGIKHPRSMQKE